MLGRNTGELYRRTDGKYYTDGVGMFNVLPALNRAVWLILTMHLQVGGETVPTAWALPGPVTVMCI